MARPRLLVLAAAGVALGLLVVALLVAADNSDPATTTRSNAGAPARTAAVEATCATGGPGAARVLANWDAVLGPVVLIGGGGQYTRGRPDTFKGLGYKVPVTVPLGMTATLSVPRNLCSHVGLVFSLTTQDRVRKNGIRGADASVRFRACATTGEPGRTGWGGGIVTDRRRCATLIVKVAGRASVPYRVQLGRPC
jgi:hypothetical protein